MFMAPTTGALPKLDLDVDSQGYLVVKPPIWTQDKNGIVGVGRNVQKDEILQSSQILLNYCKNQMEWPELPLALQTGDALIDITCTGDHLDAVYSNIEHPDKGARVDASFCNCTKIQEVDPYLNSERNQMWDVNGTTIYVSGAALTGQGKVDPLNTQYIFRFIKNGYEISFADTRSFDDTTKEVLIDFFDENSSSDLKRIQ